MTDEPSAALRTVWRCEEFLGMFGLSVSNTLEYFALSDFYDKSSINEIVKQNQRGDFYKMIETMDGISFRLVYVHHRDGPPLTGTALRLEANRGAVVWGLAVIDKVRREKDTEMVLAKYYILDGWVYQAPELYSLASATIRNAVFFMREALREAHDMFDWDLETGYKLKGTETEGETHFAFDEAEAKSFHSDYNTEVMLQKNLLELLASEVPT